MGVARYRGDDKKIGPTVKFPQIQGGNIGPLMFLQKAADFPYFPLPGDKLCRLPGYFSFL
jgi:hypothetical protein